MGEIDAMSRGCSLVIEFSDFWKNLEIAMDLGNFSGKGVFLFECFLRS